MVRLVALFADVSDLGAFRSAYEADHLPLARAMPGLISLRHHPAKRIRGQKVAHMAELLFSDQASLDAALASPEGRRAGETLALLPCGEITLLMVEGGFSD